MTEHQKRGVGNTESVYFFFAQTVDKITKL